MKYRSLARNRIDAAGRIAAALVIASVGSPIAAATDGEPLTRDSKRPNILFVFADDHASHAISAYGSTLNRTPNIDRLALEGMRFENTFCGNSICAPSRATVLTGKHTHQHGVIDNGSLFDGSQETFPKLLRGAGYQTALIGKWHLKTPPTGFDHYEVLIDQGPYYNPPMQTQDGVREHRGYTTDVLTDLALDWLENERDPDDPFLLCWWHKAPHREWVPKPEYADLFEDQDMPEPTTLFDDYVGRTTAAKSQEMTLRDHMYDKDLRLSLPTNLTGPQRAALLEHYGPRNEAYRSANLTGNELVRWRYQRYIKDYLRCVQAVDDSLGQVLDYLDRKGLAENTIVVYSSDQGFYLGDHGWYDKRWMYEESLRMPLLVRWPAAIRPGSVDDHLTQNIDFGPTFLEAAGVPVPGAMQGRSLLPLLRGEDPADWRSSIYYHYYEYPGVHQVQRHFGVRSDRYKLIRYYLIDEWELFDLKDDPNELHSVHDDPAYAEIRASLEVELAKLQREFDDPDPLRDREVVRAAFFEGRARAPGLELLARAMTPTDRAPDRIDPAWKPLTVGARVEGGHDGVIVAVGGETYGVSLYVEDGMPRFTLRNKQREYTVKAGRRLEDGRVSLVTGVLDREERLRILIDGEEVASAPGAFLQWMPQEGLTVGTDLGSPVGAYRTPAPFSGAMSDVRIYRDRPDPATIEAWRRGD